MRWILVPFLALALFTFTNDRAIPAGTENGAYTAKIATLLPVEARNNGKMGVVVKSLTSGETLFEHNAQNLFIPASNEKIITSVASLSLLKRDYRFKTEFFSGGGISEGVLHGGLYIKGYGDPTLGEPHIGDRAVFFRLVPLNINRILEDDERLDYAIHVVDGDNCDSFPPQTAGVTWPRVPPPF